jgi:hypothetical protein
VGASYGWALAALLVVVTDLHETLAMAFYVYSPASEPTTSPLHY